MSEGKETADFIQDVRATWGRAGFVLKHCDRFTIGVPDLTITAFHATLWLEVKLVDRTTKPGSRLAAVLAKTNKHWAVQLENARQLSHLGLCRYLFIVKPPIGTPGHLLVTPDQVHQLVLEDGTWGELLGLGKPQPRSEVFQKIYHLLKG